MSIRLPPHFLAPSLHHQAWLPRDPFRAQSCHAQLYAFFHTSHYFRADDSTLNPYEVLGLNPSATQADIKKQYYDLSKTHHPDRNPNNQAAASRKFTAISEAYHVIGDPTKREKFDRDQQRQCATSWSSSAAYAGYAGARKASGLSKRRTQFRGPPPSFYRSGGWGASSPKRTTNAGADGQDAQAQQQQQQQQQASSGPYGGAMGNWPFNTDPNDVPHFDRDGHYRTTSSIEEQLKKGRVRRRRIFQEEDDMIDDDTPGNVMGRFAMVMGMLCVGVGTPLLFFAGSRPGPG